MGNSEKTRPSERDDRPADQMAALLEPRSIALVGASARAGSFGHRMVTEVGRSRPGLDVRLVNPRYGEIDGRPCLGSLADLDEPVDLVLLGVPDSALEEQLALAAKRGDRSAVIFGSVVGQAADGSSLRAAVSALAADAGMAVCGGGCMGFVNVARGVRAIGYVEADPLPAGPIALVSHSGSAFSALLRSHRRLGFALAVSSGQELVTTAADYLGYALDQPETGVVALLLETMRAPERLRAGLARAAEQGVPVIALTVGTSGPGAAMVAAHSGALAGADGAWEALFDAYDVLRVHDLDELADTLELFAAGRRPRPGSGGIATVHDSGAERAMVVDLADQVGAAFSPLAEATIARLDELLDPGLIPANPLDVWGTGADTRAPVRGLTSGYGRRPRCRSGRTGHRPGHRVRRRPVLSPCAARCLGLHGRAPGLAVDHAFRDGPRAGATAASPRRPRPRGRSQRLAGAQASRVVRRSTHPPEGGGRIRDRCRAAAHLADPARGRATRYDDIVRAPRGLRPARRAADGRRKRRRGRGGGPGDRRVGGPEDRRPRGRAQVRRRRRVARSRGRQRGGCGLRRTRSAARPGGDGVGDGRRRRGARARHRARPTARAAGPGGRGRRPDRTGRRPRRCPAAGVGRRGRQGPGPVERAPVARRLSRWSGGRSSRVSWPRSSPSRPWRSSSATALEAVDINPVLARPADAGGLVAVDALVVAR